MSGFVEAKAHFIAGNGYRDGVTVRGCLFYGDRFSWNEAHFHEFQEEVIFIDAVDHAALTFFEFGQFFLHVGIPNGVCKSTALP